MTSLPRAEQREVPVLSKGCVRFLTLLVALVAAAPAWGQGPELQRYETRYHTLYTDLPPDRAREATLRVTAMVEEYIDRTAGFRGELRGRLPFYLIADRARYNQLSGNPHSGGMYVSAGDQSRLLAYAGREIGENVWQVVQHEGFHQFADQVIGGRIPLWVNEGLAEYFGDAQFTGSGYVHGLIPPHRLAAVQALIRSNAYVPLRDMMLVGRAEWGMDLTERAKAARNYHQAWSMVYFLANADDGRYRQAFGRFMREVGKGRHWEDAWDKHFGANVGEFERRWLDFWSEQPENPTEDLYLQAHLTVVTHFVARAAAADQEFESWRAFVTAALRNQLRQPDDEDQWLPQTLLRAHLRGAIEIGEWTFTKQRRRYVVTCETPNGWVGTGTFMVRRGRYQNFDIDVEATRGSAAWRKRR